MPRRKVPGTFFNSCYRSKDLIVEFSVNLHHLVSNGRSGSLRIPVPLSVASEFACREPATECCLGGPGVPVRSTHPEDPRPAELKCRICWRSQTAVGNGRTPAGRIMSNALFFVMIGNWAGGCERGASWGRPPIGDTIRRRLLHPKWIVGRSRSVSKNQC